MTKDEIGSISNPEGYTDLVPSISFIGEPNFAFCFGDVSPIQKPFLYCLGVDGKLLNT